MFVIVILVIGFISSVFGWLGTAFLFGLLLMANKHPAGAGWLYFGLILVGASIQEWAIDG